MSTEFGCVVSTIWNVSPKNINDMNMVEVKFIECRSFAGIARAQIKIKMNINSFSFATSQFILFSKQQISNVKTLVSYTELIKISLETLIE